MKHYLITRYNIRVPQWRHVDKRGRAVCDEEWMRHRWGLFIATIDSVARQEGQFEWIVLVDAETSDEWKILLEGVVFFRVIYVVDWLADLQNFLCEDSEGWIITTRLDNDDLIEPAFMATIRAAASPGEQFLNIPNGWWGEKPATHKANQFISLVESTRKSVYHTPHGLAMARHAPIKQISRERLWRTVIHERNYNNA